MGDTETIVIGSDQVSVTMLPGHGCDIVEIIDAATGVDVLFKTPWADNAGVGIGARNSLVSFLDSCRGGWQVLCPNAGDACTENGVEWGFHGEAALVPWRVESSTAHDATFSTTLRRSPIALRRTVSVIDGTVRLFETVHNTSAQPIEIMWGHHPTFGRPFLDAGSRLYAGARSVHVDDRVPGNLLRGGARAAWPDVPLAEGGVLDLGAIPGPEDSRSVIAYLEDFTERFFAIYSPHVGFGIAVAWSGVFPVAWLWQEVHASAGYPWFQRAYAVAVEPHTSAPARGVAGVREAGGSLLRLEGHGQAHAEITLAIYRDPRPVVDVSLDGRILHRTEEGGE